MDKQEKVLAILEALKAAYPDPVCALHYQKDYELLFAVRLSAQCTDERVNLITPALFARYPTLEDYAGADIAEMEDLVHSCGFYHHKARDIILGAQALLERFDGKVPGTMEELLTIPAWDGRRPICCWATCTGCPASVVCDTHVIRITNKLGLAQGKEPEKVEKQLRAILPPEESSDFCHRVVLHGRAICTARKPQCAACPLAPYCDAFTGA